ncbi:Fe-S cluster assembly protein SufD [Candidatus Poriferisocius sp.]|uniref:Fe-S cluster assembly protein SufD n=1 Tax=Candidatus Poriferisocius sp. TaxID=3101276 RepID=UPI003B01035C
MIGTRFTPEAAGAIPGPDWLVRRRVAAAEQVAAASMPSAQEEVWRYTPIGQLDLGRYHLVGDPGDRSPVPVPDHCALADTSNGCLGAVKLSPEAAAQGVEVRPLGPGDSELAAGVDVDLFAIMNAAFSVQPVLVRIPPGVDVGAPVVVRHWLDAGSDGAAVFPRLIVDAGADSSVEVLELYGSVDAAVFVSPVIEIRVAAAARVGYLAVQDLGPRVWHIGSQVSHIGSQAHMRASSAALGGEYARMRLDTHLSGRGATGDLVSLYFGDGHQTLDFRTFQDHVAPDTTSSLLFKGAVDDDSRSVYTGLIRVGPDARGTTAHQTNRNIKLSREAWAESVPNLEIENNQVSCNHASTVGPIDGEQLFYLESRGVPTEIAERLIVTGFFDEVLDRFPVPGAVPAVRDRLQAKISGLSHHPNGDEAPS